MAAGFSKAEAKRILGPIDMSDDGSRLAVALLCNVPLELLVCDQPTIESYRRRIDRFKRRLGITPPRKRRKSAA